MNSFNTFSLLFYIRTDRKNKENEASIYMRITINGQRAEISTKRYIDPDNWDSHSSKAKGYKPKYKELNQYLETLKSSVNIHHSQMVKLGEQITAQSLKNKLLGISENQRTLLEVFKYHNQNLKELEGTYYASATIKRYETTLTHVKAFLKHQYILNDILMNQVKYSFITDFEHYFKVVKKCNHNTSIKYIKNFRKIINLAIKNEWLTKDPFAKYQVRIKDVKRVYLTGEELQNLENRNIFISRLEIVRDIFVFCCYTGLSYVDVSKLRKNKFFIKKGLEIFH